MPGLNEAVAALVTAALMGLAAYIRQWAKTNAARKQEESGNGLKRQKAAETWEEYAGRLRRKLIAAQDEIAAYKQAADELPYGEGRKFERRIRQILAESAYDLSGLDEDKE